jgi:hypothetical protein
MSLMYPPSFLAIGFNQVRSCLPSSYYNIHLAALVPYFVAHLLSTTIVMSRPLPRNGQRL